MPGVKLIWQLVTPCKVARVQLAEVGLNVPVELLLKLTVPLGGLLDPDEPIVTVHVVAWLMTNGEGAQLTVVVVCPITVRGMIIK